MAQVISNKIWVTSGHYNQCWLIMDYSMSGQTMTYTLTLHFDGGCAQFRNIYVKVGDTTVASGGAHAYNQSHQSAAHSPVIFSNYTTTITGTQTVTFGGEKYVDGTSWESTTGSFSVTGGVAPSGVTASIYSIADTSVQVTGSVSSYGTPASEASRYIECTLINGSTYSDPRYYERATATSMATLIMQNISLKSGSPAAIKGNTEYHYGAIANNTALSTQSAIGTVLTKPAYITSVTVVNDGHNLMTITVNHAAEGSDDTVYTQYSYDQTNWTAVQDTFHLAVNSPTTIYFKRENTSGSTPVYSESITPLVLATLYGSVNGSSKKITKLYGSVGLTSEKITKLYGSVNGQSKLIYEDNS